MNITKEQFLTYERIRQSGVTNMFDVRAVRSLSGGVLSDDNCFEIMKNFSSLKEMYLPSISNTDAGVEE